MSHHYFVKADDGVVEAWSTTRLQFEPKHWQRDFRAQLRLAIATLASRDQLLAAQYRSPVRDSCDTENILFYNVGTGIFAAASTAGVRFERGFVVPPCHADLYGPSMHYHRYENGTDVDGDFELWREVATLARFDSVTLPRLSAASKPAAIWLALHETQAQAMQEDVWPDAFALRITLHLPSSYAAPISLLKPLLDGVIAAFGVYEGPQLKLVAERLGAARPRSGRGC